jgi:hypothetical protein
MRRLSAYTLSVFVLIVTLVVGCVFAYRTIQTYGRIETEQARFILNYLQ